MSIITNPLQNFQDNTTLSHSVSNYWTNASYDKQFKLLFNNDIKSKFNINVKFQGENTFVFHINNKEFLVRFGLLDSASRVYQCEVNGHRVRLSYFKDLETNFFNCFLNDRIFEFQVEDPKYVKEQSRGGADAGEGDALAPMPGVVDKINVKKGDRVKKGDPLAVMIAMKMEYVIKSNRDGSVKSVNCTVGQNVKKAHKLVTLAD